MPVHPNARPANPVLRQIACLIVGFGCLTTAGHVLSSVVKAPPRPQMQAFSPCVYPVQYRSIYAVPAVPNHSVQNTPPLQALICVKGRALQVTNNSPYPWHNLHVKMIGSDPTGAHVSVCPLIAPHKTRTILLRFAEQSRPPQGYCHGPLVLQWECRAGRKNGQWSGYMPM